MGPTITREEYEILETKNLAPYASKSVLSKGRKYKEIEHPIRTVYQRDRDRIIHSRAFRRLEYKTQVFVNHEGDHYRTRLTHTMEVAQIGRNIARALKLNEDLTEAIALAHDVGHPPFGHSGEKVLNTMMSEEGGFEHNRQSLRIVEKLEKRYPLFNGLNLTWEVRQGLQKYDERFSSLEAQVADVSDDIAYLCHDLDDGLSSGLLCEKDLEGLSLWHNIYMEVCKKYPSIDRTVATSFTVSSLINYLVCELLDESRKRILDLKLTDISQLSGITSKIIGFSSQHAKKVLHLREFLYKRFYNHPQVEKMNVKAQEVVKGLFTLYVNRPELLQTSTKAKLHKRTMKVVVCDYIAGMTDRFALKEHQRLLELEEKM